MTSQSKFALASGAKDAIPIGLGYFAVAFSLGIAASKIGLSASQGFFASLFTLTSTGEYAAFQVIKSGGAYVEMAIIMIVANARYTLMGFALSQKIRPHSPFLNRIVIALGITDEIFAIEIRNKGFISPYYTLGALAVAAPMWAFGTAVGIVSGGMLPVRVVSALGVALYGMFLAVVIPPCKKDGAVLATVAISFLSSFVFSKIDALKTVSEGSKTIILTLMIAAIMAFIRPIKDEC